MAKKNTVVREWFDNPKDELITKKSIGKKSNSKLFYKKNQVGSVVKTANKIGGLTKKLKSTDSEETLQKLNRVLNKKGFPIVTGKNKSGYTYGKSSK